MCSNCLDLRPSESSHVKLFLWLWTKLLGKGYPKFAASIASSLPRLGRIVSLQSGLDSLFLDLEARKLWRHDGKRQETSCRFLVSSLRWSAWSPCDKSCHGGQSHRQRRIMHFNFHGGQCPVQSLQEWDVGKLYV